MSLLDDLYAAWNEHDVEGVLDFFGEDMTYTDRAMGVTFHGRGELETFIRATFVSIPDLRFEVTSSFDDAEHFAGEALMRGDQVEDVPGLARAGSPFEVRYAIYGDHRGGRITRLVDYWNFAEWTTSARTTEQA